MEVTIPRRVTLFDPSKIDLNISYDQKLVLIHKDINVIRNQGYRVVVEYVWNK